MTEGVRITEGLLYSKADVAYFIVHKDVHNSTMLYVYIYSTILPNVHIIYVYVMVKIHTSMILWNLLMRTSSLMVLSFVEKLSYRVCMHVYFWLVLC